jgi:hypothetical protein
MRSSTGLLLLSAVLAGCETATDPATTVSFSSGSDAIVGQVVSVQLKFHEPLIPFLKAGDCPVAPEGVCAAGRVDPYGSATETVEFGVACGGACDLRTVYLPQGTLVLQETFSNPLCPGPSAPSCRQSLSGDLTDVVLSGTGIFEGATGLLVGRVRASGPEAESRLSGTLTLAH